MRRLPSRVASVADAAVGGRSGGDASGIVQVAVRRLEVGRGLGDLVGRPEVALDGDPLAVELRLPGGHREEALRRLIIITTRISAVDQVVVARERERLDALLEDRDLRHRRAERLDRVVDEPAQVRQERSLT